MDHGGMIFGLLLCAITALTALGGMALGAWIAYRIRTGGENLFRSQLETEETVGNIDDVSTDMDESFLRRHPSLLRSYDAEDDEETMLDEAASPIVREQNRRILEQISVLKNTTAEQHGAVIPPVRRIDDAA